QEAINGIDCISQSTHERSPRSRRQPGGTPRCGSRNRSLLGGHGHILTPTREGIRSRRDRVGVVRSFSGHAVDETILAAKGTTDQRRRPHSSSYWEFHRGNCHFSESDPEAVPTWNTPWQLIQVASSWRVAVRIAARSSVLAAWARSNAASRIFA